MAYFDKLQQELGEKQLLLDRFLASVDSLRGIQVVASPFVWSDGFPLGALSPLSRWFEQTPAASRPLWFQAVGNKRDQCWSGNFRSTAGQPALDFAPGAEPLKERWTNELNFLAWQPYAAKRQVDLPEKAQLHLTVQWREPHDPDYFLRVGEQDFYRTPLASLKLLLRQRDPEGKSVPADLFEVVAQSSGRPQRLEHNPSGSIYEISLDVTLDKPGRYALRVERQPDAEWAVGIDPRRQGPALYKDTGLNPIGIRPRGAPVLPALAQDWELRPRLFVETTDDTERLKGRAVFADFATDAGTVGMPADSRGVISVGAAGAGRTLHSDSATGSIPFVDLTHRPTLLSYDTLQLDGGTAQGSSIANAYAAGTAAALLSAGVPRAQLDAWLAGHDGALLRVPGSK